MFPDDDECAMNMCPENSDCTNTPGSYDCTCYDGLRYEDKECVGEYNRFCCIVCGNSVHLHLINVHLWQFLNV